MSEKKIILDSYWQIIGKQFLKQKIGCSAMAVVSLFVLIGIYAPFLASSKPLVVYYDGEIYFPLFKYLFCSALFTKKLDIFFNILACTFPFFFFTTFFITKWKRQILFSIAFIQVFLFSYYAFGVVVDPASDPTLNAARQSEIQQRLKDKGEDLLLSKLPLNSNWVFDLKYLNNYARLNKVLRYQQRLDQHHRMAKYSEAYYEKNQMKLPTLWQVEHSHEIEEIERHHQFLENNKEGYEQTQKQLPSLEQHYLPFSEEFLLAKSEVKINLAKLKKIQGTGQFPQAKSIYEKSKTRFDFVSKMSSNERKKLRKARRTLSKYEDTQANMNYILDRQKWLEQESAKISFQIMPLLRPFHWEDDAGGEQALNKYVDWWELTRINRKDLTAALIFGIRISLVVGLTSMILALSIGVPIGAIAGFYGGKIDIVVFRVLEIWESMPTLFMLLLVVSVLQTKSIFLIITVLGIFGWTGFCRFVRGETLRQRNLPYVDACKALGLNDIRIIFSHVLPNAIPPLLTLLPFAIMGAITSEAGLSFLGLGEEGSCSWGVLMDEGRSAFPGESYLLWPPGILLTILLVAIALVGDALRDAFDPKMHKS
ncbi:MAG: peptide/nickel transport system permease protein [Chlamydiales bacterium]|jgi:peptide/nickel transport system permease protein